MLRFPQPAGSQHRQQVPGRRRPSIGCVDGSCHLDRLQPPPQREHSIRIGDAVTRFVGLAKRHGSVGAATIITLKEAAPMTNIQPSFSQLDLPAKSMTLVEMILSLQALSASLRQSYGPQS